LENEFWAAIVGALVGAFVGAFPSWLLAKRASAETLKRDQESRDREDRVKGLQFYLTLSKIGNDIFSTRGQIAEMLDHEIRSDEAYPIQAKLSVLSGAETDVKNPFDHLDLCVFANTEGIEMINRIDLLGRCYTTQISLFSDFKVLKQRLFEIYEQAKSRETNADGLTTYLIDPTFSVLIDDRKSQTEIIAEGIIEVVWRNCMIVYRLILQYNEIVDGTLKRLDLPKIEYKKIVERFPDVEATGDD